MTIERLPLQPGDWQSINDHLTQLEAVGALLVTDANGAAIGVTTAANTLSDGTYGAAVQIGNTHGSFGGSGFYAPLVVYQTYGTNDGNNTAVGGHTQGFIGLLRYYGPTSLDSAEGGSYGVYLKNTGVGFTQSQQTTGWEGDAQIEGANHATGFFNALAGRLTVNDTATVDNAHVIYAGLTTKAGGATITNHYGFFENASNAGIGTNNWTLYGPNLIHGSGLEGNAAYYAEGAMESAFGFKTWNGDPTLLSAANTAPTAGTVYAVAVPYRQGQVVTYTDWFVSVAGAGTAPTHIFTGIVDSTGKMLAQSNDDRANTAWTTTNTIGRSPLSGAYTILASGLFYHVFLQVGAWGTTQHTMNRATGVPTALPAGGLAQATGVTTAQSALPANGATIAGGLTLTNGLRYWTGSE